MKYAAIPTLYKNIRFRSRLEARWAVFLDSINFVWKYEPYDMDGWIPDFTFGPDDEVFAEVKPFSWGNCKDLMSVSPSKNLLYSELEIHLIDKIEDNKDLNKAFKHVDTLREHRRMLCILGSEPLEFEFGISVGAFFFDKKRAALICIYKRNGVFKLAYHPLGYFFDIPDGGECAREEIKQLWREAGNTVQWCFG